MRINSRGLSGLAKRLEDAAKSIDGLKVSVPLGQDTKGFIEKECPIEECKFQFRVFAQNWTEKSRDEAVFCPKCGGSAPANQFFTTEQVAIARKKAFQEVKGIFSDSLKGAHPIRSTISSIEASPALANETNCSNCKAKYASSGDMSYCPCC
ncbi:MAG TPA: hypothetical protein PK765_06870 [bacterium]|nr:hypothetical protein [bacterium]